MPSLLEAIEHKYGNCHVCQNDEDDLNNSAISVAIFVPRRHPRACVPSLLVLNNCDIATAGHDGQLDHEILEKCALVEELDLATNSLSEWGETLAILSMMPRLRFVNLSFNKLAGPMGDLENGCRWENLSSLVLNATGAAWGCVRCLLSASPKLEELHLSLNEYDSVQLSEELVTDNLKKLHFNSNPVCSWIEIRKLGRSFPGLECLVLADCPLGGLKEGDESDFPALRVLNLDGTRLSSWQEIETLAKFPALTCVRVRGLPLWEKHGYTEHERRQLLIARLPNVRMLNGGGPIEPQEREDAERAFIRYYSDRAEADRPSRYEELVAVHGKLDPLVHVDLRPEKRVRVTFTCGTNSETRSVDVYRTVSDLKQRLESFAGFPATKMRLFYVDQDLRDIQGPEEMKYPHKQLYSYNIQSGDEIIIDSKQKMTPVKNTH